MTRRYGLAGLVVLAGLAGVGLARRALAPQAAMVTLSVGYLQATAIDMQTHRAFIETASYTPGFSDHLDVLDTVSGRIVRTLTVDRFPGGGLAVDERANRVFVATGDDSFLRVLDARSGALLHTVALVSPASADTIQGVAMDTRTDRVFVGSTLYNTVQTLDARSGALLHAVRNAGDTLTVDEQEGRVFAYVANNGGSAFTLSVLDARTGTLLRALTLNQQPVQVVPSPTTGRVIVAEAASIVILDARTGRVVTTLPTAVAPQLLSEMNGRLLFSAGASQGTTLIDIDVRTGRVAHTAALNPGVSQWAIDRRRGRVFASGGATAAAGHVWMIDAHSGAILHTSVVGPNPGTVAVDERSDRVFVASSDLTSQTGSQIVPGSVAELDARSGRVLRTIPCDADANALLLDARAGHVFALCAGTPKQVTDMWGWIPQVVRGWLPFLPPPSSSTQPIPTLVRMIDATR